MPARSQKKNTFAMRNSGVRGVLIYCSDYKCSHLVTMSDYLFRAHPANAG